MVFDFNSSYFYANAERTVPDRITKVYTDDEMISHGTFISKWKANKKDLEKDNDIIPYSLMESSNIRQTDAPIKELY